MSKRNHFTLGRACDCGALIGDKSQTGKCRPCYLRWLNANPDIVRKRNDNFRKMLAENPAERQRRAMQMKINKRNGMKNPAARERVRQAAMRNLPKCFTPEAVAKRAASMPAVALAISATRLAWCPPERRDQYRHLVRYRHIRAADARAIIMAEIQAELDALSPFERQMRALENGAKLIANDARPAGNQVVRRFG